VSDCEDQSLCGYDFPTLLQVQTANRCESKLSGHPTWYSLPTGMVCLHVDADLSQAITKWVGGAMPNEGLAEDLEIAEEMSIRRALMVLQDCLSMIQHISYTGSVSGRLRCDGYQASS
jgi:hypothetical protein